MEKTKTLETWITSTWLFPKDLEQERAYLVLGDYLHLTQKTSIPCLELRDLKDNSIKKVSLWNVASDKELSISELKDKVITLRKFEHKDKIGIWLSLRA